jgi:hypothetical protein
VQDFWRAEQWEIKNESLMVVAYGPLKAYPLLFYSFISYTSNSIETLFLFIYLLLSFVWRMQFCILLLAAFRTRSLFPHIWQAMIHYGI